MLEESFLSHLIELRNHLIRAMVVFIAVLLALVLMAPELYAWLSAPLLASLPKGGQMIATEVVTPFLVPIKVAMVAAFVISLPFTLYQIWAFVAPGLYRHERRLGGPLVVASSLLFLAGMSFAYFVVFPTVFRFISTVAPEGVAVMTDINAYFDFVLTMFIAFGLAFQVPVLVVVLVGTGIVELDTLRNARPYVVVGAFVVGAIFTPPDVVSQLLLAVPMWLLYEIGLVVARFLRKKAEEEPYRPLSDEEMEAELDAMERTEGQDRG